MPTYTPPPFHSKPLSKRPLYGQVMEWLTEVIERDFEHGARFFTERELMETLKVSQPTVRRAMQELVGHGKLRRHVGKGTFVQKFAATRLVGIIAPHYQSSVLMQQVNAVAELCHAFDCNLRVHHIRQGEAIRDMVRGLDAHPREERMILLGHSHETAWTLFDELDHCGFRSVCSLPFAAGYPGESVCVDTAEGVRMALDHLVELGHERILFVINEPVELAYIRIRLDALHREVERRGLNHCVFLECETPQWADSFEAAYAMMGRAFSHSLRPTAIVPISGVGAWAALRYSAEHRVDVPESISVFAFDDLPGSELLYPALTGLSVDRNEIAQRTLEILWDEATASRQILVPPKLLVRESTTSVCKQSVKSN